MSSSRPKLITLVLMDCSRRYPLNTGLTAVKVQKVNVIQCYAPTNNAQEDCKTVFYGRLQAVINKQASRDVILLMGAFNVKIGSDNTGRDQSMGKHGLGEMKENGEVLNDFCTFNDMVIDGSVYPHKRVHNSNLVIS